MKSEKGRDLEKKGYFIGLKFRFLVRGCGYYRNTLFDIGLMEKADGGYLLL